MSQAIEDVSQIIFFDYLKRLIPSLLVCILTLVVTKRYINSPYFKNPLLPLVNYSIFALLNILGFYNNIILPTSAGSQNRVQESFYFFVLQIIVVAVFVFVILQNNRREYEHKLMEARLDNMAKYVDQLEASQDKIRAFRHDYKNLLTTVKSLLNDNRIDDLLEFVAGLDSYSKRELDIKNDKILDLTKVKNPYVKALLLEKFYLIADKGVLVYFECPHNIQDFYLADYDLIRILGILLDNALEAVADQNQARQINILFYLEGNQIEIYIENSLNQAIDLEKIQIKGFSSKANHTGLGLSNLRRIAKKYPNLFIHLENQANTFSVQLIITAP
ncbi:GHKL domain-containing protein [Aerococcus urinaehominis]|nr:GHKL domain-containing protein [Aerococcus urinaehominis]SDM47795.1 GHKL domain-containing protein [Aerococcus urinaehominis]